MEPFNRESWRRTAAIIAIVLGAMVPVIFASARPAAQETASPVAIATPRATPPATPVAPGCGNEASSPTEIAAVFVAAATALDLERAALCFAPDRQPAAWEDVYLAGPPDDLSGCRGVPYIATGVTLEPDLTAIIFIFDRACAIAGLDDRQRDLYDADTLAVTTVVVQVHQSDGRWYVQDAFASVSD